MGSCGEPQPSTQLSLSPSLCHHAGAYPAGHCSSLALATSLATASGHQLAPPHCSSASVALADTGAGGVEGSSSCGIARRCRGPALAWRPLLVQPAALARQWWHRPVWAPTVAREASTPQGCQRPDSGCGSLPGLCARRRGRGGRRSWHSPARSGTAGVTRRQRVPAARAASGSPAPTSSAGESWGEPGTRGPRR